MNALAKTTTLHDGQLVWTRMESQVASWVTSSFTEDGRPTQIASLKAISWMQNLSSSVALARSKISNVISTLSGAKTAHSVYHPVLSRFLREHAKILRAHSKAAQDGDSSLVTSAYERVAKYWIKRLRGHAKTVSKRLSVVR